MHNSMSLVNLFHTAKAEAEASFGNSDAHVEKWIEDAHHIEVQILGNHRSFFTSQRIYDSIEIVI